MSYYGVREGDTIEIVIDNASVLSHNSLINRRPGRIVNEDVILMIEGGRYGKKMYTINGDAPLQRLHDDIYRDYLSNNPDGEVIILIDGKSVDLNLSWRDYRYSRIAAVVNYVKKDMRDVMVEVLNLDGMNRITQSWRIDYNAPLQQLHDLIYYDNLRDNPNSSVDLIIEGKILDLNRSARSYDVARYPHIQALVR